MVIAIAFGALVCCAVAVAGVLVIGAVAFSDTDVDDPAPDVVENVARVRLPKSTRNLRARLEGFQDRLIWARFEMQADDLPAFERSLACRLSAPSSVQPQLPKISRPSWWSDAKLSRSCHGSGPGFDQTLIVDVTTLPELTVLVVVFEK